MWAGCSNGGMLAMSFATGVQPEEVRKLMEYTAPVIFEVCVQVVRTGLVVFLLVRQGGKGLPDRLMKPKYDYKVLKRCINHSSTFLTFLLLVGSG